MVYKIKEFEVDLSLLSHVKFSFYNSFSFFVLDLLSFLSILGRKMTELHTYIMGEFYNTEMYIIPPFTDYQQNLLSL